MRSVLFGSVISVAIALSSWSLLSVIELKLKVTELEVKADNYVLQEEALKDIATLLHSIDKRMSVLETKVKLYIETRAR